MQLKIFKFSPFQVNTFVLFDETKECVIIDPACLSAQEKKQLSDFIQAEALKPIMLLNTHCHFDHIFGNKFVKELYSIDIHAHTDDEFFLGQMVSYAATNYGLKLEQPPAIDVFITEKDTIKFGNSSLQVLHVPGHSPGSLVFHSRSFAIVGDVLFRDSIGRTDLPGSNHNLLLEGIRQKLFSLPAETVVYPGHGEKTSIGYEMEHNPFLQMAE